MDIKNKARYILILFLVIPVIYCAQQDSKGQENGTEERWLVPKDEVIDGGPGKDGIPALENPQMIPLDQATFMSDDELVIGVRIGDIVKAYPHKILDYHEIVNDLTKDNNYTLSYCPLTGTALLWNIKNSGNDPTFGVSGLLYNSNLILYDRETESYWSQMFFLCINGSRIEEKADISNPVETTWGTWKKLYPQSTVLSTNTGYNRDYDDYPYGKYKTSNNLLFPVSNEDTRLHSKERVHGIILEDKTVVYTIRSFTGGLNIINDEPGEYVVIISSDHNIAVSFGRKLSDGSVAEFTKVNGKFPIIIKDSSGSEWDVFGRAISGKYSGEQLIPTTSFNSYWFGWAAFYPDAEIREGPSPLTVASDKSKTIL